MVWSVGSKVCANSKLYRMTIKSFLTFNIRPSREEWKLKVFIYCMNGVRPSWLLEFSLRPQEIYRKCNRRKAEPLKSVKFRFPKCPYVIFFLHSTTLAGSSNIFFICENFLFEERISNMKSVMSPIRCKTRIALNWKREDEKCVDKVIIALTTYDTFLWS